MPYLPAGTASTLAMASRPSPSRPARSKPGAISAAASESAGAISTMRLPSSCDLGVRLDQVALGQIGHPVEVGRDEDVGRRALLDLLGERRARRVGDRRLLAGLGLPGGVDVVERVLQARGGEDRHVRRHRRRRGEQSRHGETGERLSSCAYASIEHVDPPRMSVCPRRSQVTLLDRCICSDIAKGRAFWRTGGGQGRTFPTATAQVGASVRAGTVRRARSRPGFAGQGP